MLSSMNRRKRSQVALLFLFFHRRLCGPLANSHFHYRPDHHHRPNSHLEAAHHRADKAKSLIRRCDRLQILGARREPRGAAFKERHPR